MKPKPETDRVRIGRLTDTDRYWIGLLSPEQRQTALVAAAKKQHADVLRGQEKMIEPGDFPVGQMPTKAAWIFLLQRWNDGSFTIMQDANGRYVAHFHDDNETIPIQDMDYNSEIGLFRNT